MYKRKKKKILRRPLETFEIFNTIGCDLLDLQKFYFANQKNFVLVAVDLTSKFLFLRAIKQKTKECMIEAFKSILEIIKKLGFKLKYYWSDAGQEFLSIKDYMLSQGVEHYKVQSELKCTIAEQYVKLTAQKLYRIMTFRKSAKWVDYLSTIEQVHNENAKNAGYTPNEIVKDKSIAKKVMRNNALVLKKKLQKIDNVEKSRERRGIAIKVGDRVRVLDTEKNPFEKSTYLPKFSNLGIVEKVFFTTPLTYQVSSKPRKKYYQEQLSLTKEPIGSETADTRASYIFIQRRKKTNTGRVLRSGQRSNEQYEYLIRGIADPNISKYINEIDFNKMKKKWFDFGNLK